MRKAKVSLAMLAAFVAACGSSGTTQATPPTTQPPQAIINVLIDPNPIQAVSSGDSNYPWDFRFNLQVSDAGGVGFIVSVMQTTVKSAATGATLNTTASNPFVGVKIPALGQATRQFHEGPYRMENFARQATLTLQMTFVDDGGHTSVFNSTVNVVHAQRPMIGLE
jgi:hypothetical protein